METMPTMETIDEKIDELARMVAAGFLDVRTDIKELDIRIEHLETKVEKIEVRLENVENRLENVEGRLENVENRLENVEVYVIKIDKRLGRIESNYVAKTDLLTLGQS